MNSNKANTFISNNNFFKELNFMEGLFLLISILGISGVICSILNIPLIIFTTMLLAIGIILLIYGLITKKIRFTDSSVTKELHNSKPKK